VSHQESSHQDLSQPASSRQSILMCAPDYFGIDYVINPWMEGNCGKADRALAVEQWSGLKRALETQTEVVLIRRSPACPIRSLPPTQAWFYKKSCGQPFQSAGAAGRRAFFPRLVRQHDFDIAAWPADVSFEGQATHYSIADSQFFGLDTVSVPPAPLPACWKKPSTAERLDYSLSIRASIISTPASARWRAAT